MTVFLEKTGFFQNRFFKNGLPPNCLKNIQNLKKRKKTVIKKGRFLGSPKKHPLNLRIDFQKFLKKINWFILRKKREHKNRSSKTNIISQVIRKMTKKVVKNDKKKINATNPGINILVQKRPKRAFFSVFFRIFLYFGDIF